MRKLLAEAPPRLQCMLLQLQQYSFDLKLQPGKEMVLADMLSRAYIPRDPMDNSLEEEVECAVHLITENAPISDSTLDEIKQKTKTDTALTKLMTAIHDGWPEKITQVPKEIQDYWSFRDKHCETDRLIFKRG